jgi:hypothetical protein
MYQVELLEFRKGRVYATVRLQKLDSGWSSEWWITHNFGDNVRVSGCLYIPLFAENADGAERRCRLMADEVLDFASWAGGGVAGVGGQADDGRRAHAKRHLMEHIDNLSVTTRVERTVILYELALQFNINNPAALIAQIETLPSVRTIHDRLAHARRIGLLDSPGKGNRRKKDAEPYVPEDDEPELDYDLY